MQLPLVPEPSINVSAEAQSDISTGNAAAGGSMSIGVQEANSTMITWTEETEAKERKSGSEKADAAILMCLSMIVVCLISG